jgi:hypothetical protein
MNLSCSSPYRTTIIQYSRMSKGQRTLLLLPAWQVLWPLSLEIPLKRHYGTFRGRCISLLAFTPEALLAGKRAEKFGLNTVLSRTVTYVVLVFGFVLAGFAIAKF